MGQKVFSHRCFSVLRWSIVSFPPGRLSSRYLARMAGFCFIIFNMDSQDEQDWGLFYWTGFTRWTRLNLALKYGTEVPTPNRIVRYSGGCLREPQAARRGPGKLLPVGNRIWSHFLRSVTNTYYTVPVRRGRPSSDGWGHFTAKSLYIKKKEFCQPTCKKVEDFLALCLLALLLRSL